MRSYRVATFKLRLQTDNVFVVFNDGWHETEVGDEGSGRVAVDEEGGDAVVPQSEARRRAVSCSSTSR